MNKKTNYTQLFFNIPAAKANAFAECDGKKSIEVHINDGVLSVNIYYEFNDKPLCMTGKVNINDAVKVKLIPYRIELWINDILVDEEWPAGNCLYGMGDEIQADFLIELTEGEYVEEKQPDIIGVFQNAEGWQPEENVRVGDCMVHVHDGRFHVIYLKDRHQHGAKWGLGAHQWEHISTDDFVNWQIHPMVVPIDDPSEGAICTGCWVEKDGIQYLYYSIRGLGYDKTSVMRRSISTDGYHYKKDRDYGFTLSEKYCTASERDPQIVLDDNGLYHMFVTTSIKEEGAPNALAHLTSTDLDIWTEKEEPILEVHVHQPECPSYFEYKGYYYLTYNLGGQCHYKYSKKPFTDWQEPENPLIPCGTVPKCAVWKDKIIFVGFNKTGNYGGTLTFKTATVNELHELVFEE